MGSPGYRRHGLARRLEALSGKRAIGGSGKNAGAAGDGLEGLATFPSGTIADGKGPVELPFGIPLWRLKDCPHIEVKYNDVLLPELQVKNPPRVVTFTGPSCPSPGVPDRQTLAGRIPLHLQYRMDHAGTYFGQ